MSGSTRFSFRISYLVVRFICALSISFEQRISEPFPPPCFRMAENKGRGKVLMSAKIEDLGQMVENRGKRFGYPLKFKMCCCEKRFTSDPNAPPDLLTTIAGPWGTFSADAQWNPPPSTKWNPPPSCRGPHSPRPRRNECSLPGYGEEWLNSHPHYVLKPN